MTGKKLCSTVKGLIVTFLALGAPDHFNSHTVNLLILQILVEFFVDGVKFIISKLDLSFPVTVHAPAHAQISKLLNLAHFLDFSMAGLALYFAGVNVL